MSRELDIPGWTKSTMMGVTTWRSDSGITLAISGDSIELQNQREGSAFASVRFNLLDSVDISRLLIALRNNRGLP